MTDEEKLEIVTDHLTGYLTITISGGYPGESKWIGDTMAYTDSRGGEFSELKTDSSLGTITRQEMLDWYDRAAMWLEKLKAEEPDVDETMSTAFYETERGIA